ncbi:MAG: sugar transferase [Clostridiales bacterium]|nr:sugar transferase [Clostridiales bacterium]
MEQYKRLILNTGRVVLTLFLVGLFALVWRQQYNEMIMQPFKTVGNYLVYAVYGVIIFVFFKLYGAYRVGFAKFGDLIFSQALSLVFTNFLLYAEISLIGRGLMPVAPLLFTMIEQELVMIGWTLLMQFIYRTLYPPKRMLLIFGTESGRSLQKKIERRPDKFRIQEMISIDNGLKIIESYIEENKANIDAIVIADVKSEKRNELLKYCFDREIQVYVTPKLSDIIMRASQDVHLFDTALYQCHNMALTIDERIVKRTMDIILSGLVFIIVSPIMLATAVAIKIEDHGPVFFRQKRCTKDERVFEILKFRSMIVGAEKDGEVKPATDHDPRITKVGRIIRPLRIDELPQLLNILKGDMSIVGPRPERVEHVRKYKELIPEFSYRHKVKAGLTGYAQIMGKYNTSAYDKLKLDLMYIENYSIFQDLKLILMTIKILFKKESSEGFQQ